MIGWHDPRSTCQIDFIAMKFFPELDYDKLMRLPVVLFYAYLSFREISFLQDFLENNPIQADVHFMTALSARISLILFLLLLVGLNSIRTKPLNKAQGWQPKLSALIGLTFGSLMLLLPRATPSPWFDLLSALMLFAGNYLCIVALLHLGRSISIMAEARQLITNGPYSLVRHPLYFAEEIAMLGVFLLFRSWTAAAILCIHFAFQVQRMLNEERILSETFPDYQPYMQRTARFIPGLW